MPMIAEYAEYVVAKSNAPQPRNPTALVNLPLDPWRFRMLSIAPLMDGTALLPIESSITGSVTRRSPDQIARSRLAPSKMTGREKHDATPTGTMSICAVYAPENHIRFSWSSLERNQP